MKKSAILLTFVVGFLVFNVSAQERRPTELSGGVSAFSRGDSSGRLPYGWNVGFGTGVHRNISIVAEFSGYASGSDYIRDPGVRFCIGQQCAGTQFRYIPAVRVRQYLLGPRFSFPIDSRFDVLAHALTGVVNRNTDGDSSTGLGIGLGGGVDMRLSEYFVGRMFADWLPSQDQDAWNKKGARVGIALVFRPQS